MLLEGGSLGAEFNIQRGVFIPKNSEVEGVAPRADELRTLGLKNSDNKIITGTNIAQFSSIVSKHACSIQRGFVQDRQFVLNIPDFDSISRAQANFSRFSQESILALWDFKSAFPSIMVFLAVFAFSWTASSPSTSLFPLFLELKLSSTSFL